MGGCVFYWVFIVWLFCSKGVFFIIEWIFKVMLGCFLGAWKILKCICWSSCFARCFREAVRVVGFFFWIAFQEDKFFYSFLFK